MGGSSRRSFFFDPGRLLEYPGRYFGQNECRRHLRELVFCASTRTSCDQQIQMGGSSSRHRFSLILDGWWSTWGGAFLHKNPAGVINNSSSNKNNLNSSSSDSSSSKSSSNNRRVWSWLHKPTAYIEAMELMSFSTTKFTSDFIIFLASLIQSYTGTRKIFGEGRTDDLSLRHRRRFGTSMSKSFWGVISMTALA